MLKIGLKEMQFFEDEAKLIFEDEMFEHSKKFVPQYCKIIDEQPIRSTLRQAIQKANSFGFTYRGTIRLYIEMMFIFGSDFDTDPQYPILRKWLLSNKDTDEQLEIASKLCAIKEEYTKQVNGSNNENFNNAIKVLNKTLNIPITSTTYNFDKMIVQELTNLFPEKIHYIGKNQFSNFIQLSYSKINKHGLSSHTNKLLLVKLMFLFGHGCLNGPLYPWLVKIRDNNKGDISSTRINQIDNEILTFIKNLHDINQEGFLI
ncbi:MAG: hypothetical protein ACC657_11225 [Thiohalomonadales bacterium]